MRIFSNFFKGRDAPVNRTSGSAYSFFMGGSTSGKRVNERTAMQMTAVYSCVRILSEAVAGLPLQFYRYTADGGKEKAVDHPLYFLFHDEPNPEMTSFVFRETLMTHLLLWGNAYSQIIRNARGEIIALYPLMPDRMTVNRDENGQLYYEYYMNTDDAHTMKGTTVRLQPHDVLHIPGLGFDGLVGYSPIAMAKNAIGMAIACEEYGAKFFANGAAPSGVLEHPGTDEMLITVHRWFANKSCPGNWLYARLGDLAAKVTARLGGGEAEVIPSGMQAREFASLTEAQVVAKVGALFTDDQKKSGILASVSMAQFILESGYGKSELAQGANNCFGMKKSLSGNTWGGSTWDGSSVYTKKTQEQNADGSYMTITADFRRYSCVEDSIADHSAYLLGAKKGSKLRYDGLKGCTDYKKAVQIIKDGGYATSLTYVDKLCSIIERWKLTQYDVAGEASDVVKYYRVRKSWEDAASQLGAYTILANAKAMADKHPGYEVYDWNGKQVYPEVADDAASRMANADCPFLVKVNISDLNIRKGPGTNYDRVQFCPVGVYTIMEVKTGQGSRAGWGRLKSGIGWLSLDFCKRL